MKGIYFGLGVGIVGLIGGVPWITGVGVCITAAAAGWKVTHLIHEDETNG